MGTISTKLFVERLADYLANLSPTPLARTGSSIAVFAHESDDAAAAAVFSTVRCYDPRIPYVPTPRASIQIDTRAANVADALNRAELLAGRLLDSDNRPGRMLGITGFMIVAVLDFRPPRYVTVDSRNRAIYACNFECFFRTV